MRLHNHLEETVEQLVDRLAVSDPDFCGCEQCRTDVAALALGRLRPAYSSTPVGHAVRTVTSDRPRARSEALVEVLKAAQTIKERPHH
jgi:competence protein ComFB